MTPNELARFASKFVPEPNSGCWLWDGCVNNRGYGQLRVFRDGMWRAMLAHRLSYEHHVGAIPAGAEVCHRCDVPACCNPDHLFIGTHADNMADMTAKGRRGTKRARGERVGGSRLRAVDVLAIRALRARGETYRSIAKQFGVRPVTIGQVVRRESWRHL